MDEMITFAVSYRPTVNKAIYYQKQIDAHNEEEAKQIFLKKYKKQPFYLNVKKSLFQNNSNNLLYSSSVR